MAGEPQCASCGEKARHLHATRDGWLCEGCSEIDCGVQGEPILVPIEKSIGQLRRALSLLREGQALLVSRVEKLEAAQGESMTGSAEGCPVAFTVTGWPRFD